jgi:peroxiredoxin
MIPIGSTAPLFSLKSKSRAGGLVDIELDQYLGKKPVILFFFPFAFTKFCTKELQAPALKDYTKLGAHLIAISVDSPFSQAIWARVHKIKVPLASDLNHETIKAYDVVLPNYDGIGDTAARAVALIDRQGKIAYAQQTDHPDHLPDFFALKSALAALSP